MLTPLFRRVREAAASKAKALRSAAVCAGGLLAVLALGIGCLAVKKLLGSGASERVAAVLRLAEADDATLPEAVRNRAEWLEDIDSPALRCEVMWRLLSALMDRGMLSQAQDALQETLSLQSGLDGDENALWTKRVQRAARALAQEGCWAQAQELFRRAEETLAQGENPEAYRNALRERAVLLAAGCGGSAAERMGELQAMLEPLRESGGIRAELMTLLGMIALEQGDQETASVSFREAMQGESEPELMPATAQICLGIACRELGDHQNAQKWLEAALNQTGSRRDHVRSAYDAMGLRELAAMALKSGLAQAALDCLYRAGTLAQGNMPTDALFWLSLAEQRAWALYIAREYHESLRAFLRVLEEATHKGEKWRAQPLEGIARCLLAVGRVDEVLPHAEECLSVRERLLADDKEGLGRVLLLLGQTHDQLGQAEKAAEMYGRAAENMPQGSSEQCVAVISRASSLEQAQQWELAAQAWEKALQMSPEWESAPRESIAKHLEQCRKRALGDQPQAATPDPAPKKASPKPAVKRPAAPRAKKPARRRRTR